MPDVPERSGPGQQADPAHDANPGHPAAAIVNAMSVDVEDYFHVSAFAGAVRQDQWDSLPPRVDGTTHRILELFAAAGVRATFFVLGWIAERQPALIRAIVAHGHELASHGYAHVRVTDQSPDEFRRDAARSRLILEDAAGVAVIGYRAASFSITRAAGWAFEELAAAGYRYSSSIAPVRHDHYGDPDAPRRPFLAAGGRMLEIPIGTIHCLGWRMSLGGGFFRALPYRMSRAALTRANHHEQRPAVFYFHPWEIDPGQPRMQAPSLARLRHYLNLHRMEPKLVRLLADHRWGRIDQVFSDQLTAGKGGHA